MSDESWRDQSPERHEAPEWYWVWTWMRSHGDFRSLPQQQRPSNIDDDTDPRPIKTDLNMAEYGGIRLKWINAGSPKRSLRQIMEMQK